MSLEKFKSKFIVFEGEDGVGKSTIAQALNEELNKNSIPSIYTYEPGAWSGKLGETFRDYCKNKKYNFTDLSTLFLFYIDRQQHIQEIILPYLQKGYTVISDRFVLSSQIYQFQAKDLINKYSLDTKMMEWLLDITAMDSYGVTLKPELCFVLSKELKRQNMEDTDKFETAGISFQQKVKEGYQQSLKKNADFIPIFIQEGESVQRTLQQIIDYVQLH